MVWKLLGTGLVLSVLGVVVLVARDQLSSEDWHNGSPDAVPTGDSESQG